MLKTTYNQILENVNDDKKGMCIIDTLQPK